MDNEFTAIYLTVNKRRTLRRIVRKREVPISFCSADCWAALERYGLVYIDRDSIQKIYGIEGHVQGEPKAIKVKDKALRYLIYRREHYFEGKLPVVIAIIALIFSIFSVALQFLPFIQ